MELSRYWQNFGEMRNWMFADGVERLADASMCRVGGKRGGAIMYGGRLMSREVYLAVPTFRRRGIMLGV